MGNVELLPVRSAERVGVLLNANARSVSDALKRELENFVPPEDLYYSRCFDDARSIARQVLDKGYRTVLTGGGDGTFVGYVNCLFEQARQPSASTARGALKLMPVPAHEILMPRFGVLRLGTGNAVAEFAGASGRRLGVVEDILRARSGEVSMARPLHLLVHEGKRAPFAGLGIDAKVLNDYVSITDHIGPGGAGRRLRASSIFTATRSQSASTARCRSRWGATRKDIAAKCCSRWPSGRSSCLTSAPRSRATSHSFANVAM